MGITVGPTYITDQGFEVSPLYLSLASTRILPLGNGNVQFTCMFNAYKSRDDKVAGRNPITLPYGQNIGEMIITNSQLNQTPFYTLVYNSVQNVFSGYTLSNVFETDQIDYSQYIYNSNGYDINGNLGPNVQV